MANFKIQMNDKFQMTNESSMANHLKIFGFCDSFDIPKCHINHTILVDFLSKIIFSFLKNLTQKNAGIPNCLYMNLLADVKI